MTYINKHTPGSFCWIELGTTDQEAAKNFYSSLFGWAVNDVLVAPNDLYSMFQLEGRDVGAAYTLRPEQRAHGAQPHWMVYVAVESADDAARKAAELGGKVLTNPFDVSDVGRMAVLEDPTGAVFSVWQPGKHIGIRIAGVEGAFCWADLSTPDPAQARQFYSSLFGWEIAAKEQGLSGYLHIANEQVPIGGIAPLEHRDPAVPPHWLIYFAVQDCDAVTAKAEHLTAKISMPPTTLENVGSVAVLADPEGAAFALYQPAPQVTNGAAGK